MKKLFRIFIILSITALFLSCGQEATTYEAKKVLSKHLIERYGEEFEIGYMGRRSDGKEVWYEAEIYPSKYVGTPKERDKYYRESGTVNIKKGIFGEKLGKAGDTYGIVEVNESAEEFYGKRLKELFGDNVLQVYDIWFNRILENYSFENIIKVSDEERTALIIKGGIYIFGRVENDEDREWYRKQIYEFIQFMKETGTFEYVDLNFTISDERIFSDKFFNNSKLQLDMKKYGNYIEPKGRNQILNQTNKSYKNTNRKIILDRINNLNKSNIDNEFYGIYWLYTKVYSPKYIESQKLKNKIKKEYNNIFDIEFSVEGYKD
ncbi:hypothetical protein C4N20_13745 [Fusobacterium ulcerans]|uniref:YARHG domain-containing protein n=1 Tax=Fusobacterium ulcerans TaxID=861 RepID=A0AAX2J9H3_9FUSO|nr:hypothetical protein [Fusobacterium ulcerans]AVQ29104.1 hypothetical protein C4N20_13745 [Fusobacterium ulcerans]EFS26572.1 hypothetical protein FUAG_02087 [Fusobacterium ulcerans ATCC 49185]SQJ02373.1 Uncharacterised protein [Fusobacterium ulcerans]